MPIYKFQLPDWITTDLDANGFLPLEDDITRYYFDTKGHPQLSKEDIDQLGKCLRKMLVLDPKNRVEAHELLGDPWFTKRSTKPGSSVMARMVERCNQRSLRHIFGINPRKV